MNRSESASVFKLLAVSPPGLEFTTARELGGLGIEARPESGGVAFSGGLRELYLANLWLRSASRVLLRVADFRMRDLEGLRRRVGRYPWELYLPRDSRMRVRVTSRHSRLYHSGAVSERVVQGVADRCGWVPLDTPEAEEESLRDAGLLVVRIVRDRCTLSVDSSGEHLHRRGYRLATAKAPLRENLAAGMLLAAGWSGQAPLLDPFCGSGTIPIEAALFAQGIPPGGKRTFAFERWRNFDCILWQEMRNAALGLRPPTACPRIAARDWDEGALRAARENASRAGVLGALDIGSGTLDSLFPLEEGPGWIVTNPPFGVRIGSEGQVVDLHRRFGSIIRDRFAGWRVVVLSANPRLAAALGFRMEKVTRFVTGGIPVALLVGEA